MGMKVNKTNSALQGDFTLIGRHTLNCDSSKSYLRNVKKMKMLWNVEEMFHFAMELEEDFIEKVVLLWINKNSQLLCFISKLSPPLREITILYLLLVGEGTLWHLQKFLQYIKYIILKLPPPSFSFLPLPPFLEQFQCIPTENRN
jgi:hypothetical protein